jgi:hypothetical protein
MRARQLTPNLIQLTRLRFVNAFLVREDDGFTLVGNALRDPESEAVRAIERAYRALC